MPNTFECFREYHALKAHFTTPSYDYIKYNGKMKSITPVSLERNKQRYLFERLAKMKDPRGFIIANLLADKVWIGDMTEGIYKAWRKRMDSLDYSLMEEVKKVIGENINESLNATKGYPRFFKEYIKGNVSLELIIAVDKVMDGIMIDHWNNCLRGDILWEEVYRKINKYSPFFLQNDLTSFQKAIRSYYEKA